MANVLQKLRDINIGMQNIIVMLDTKQKLYNTFNASYFEFTV